MIIKLSFMMFLVAGSSIELLFKLASVSSEEREYPSTKYEIFITIILLASFTIASLAGIYLL